MAILHGRVVDPNRRPVAEAAVYFISAPVAMPDIAQLTGFDGQFSLSVGAEGKYVVGASADEWGAGQTSFEVGGNEALAIEIQLKQPEGRM